jgi:hypothetical protein
MLAKRAAGYAGLGFPDPRRVGTTEMRTLAAYVEALGGRLEIIADFGDQRLAFAEPGTEAA